ncbi:hypothetical protein ABW20_dc0109763 [Dactylellina cionopaga]|nr:hypothetical protein ABW20_dc0109763 [Dactylellina cionopaga]
MSTPTKEQQEEWNRIGLARVEADTIRLQKYIAAMERDTVMRREHLKYQKLLLTNGILFAKDHWAWLSCTCDFCVCMRYMRQYEGIDDIGKLLWEDESYKRCREYLKGRELKACECAFCKGVIGRGDENEPQKHAPVGIIGETSRPTIATQAVQAKLSANSTATYTRAIPRRYTTYLPKQTTQNGEKPPEPKFGSDFILFPK